MDLHTLAVVFELQSELDAFEPFKNLLYAYGRFCEYDLDGDAGGEMTILVSIENVFA